MAANTPLGKVIGALPSGRKACVPLADGVSPSQGTDKSPTEVIKSVAHYDHTRHLNGNLLNMKFEPSTLAGDVGTQRWVSLLKSFFDMGGWHLQCNVIDNEVLKKAQETPEDYPDLMVRVALDTVLTLMICAARPRTRLFPVMHIIFKSKVSMLVRGVSYGISFEKIY